MVLVAVAVRAINHHDLALLLLLQCLLCNLYVLGAVVRSLCATTQNHKAMLVSSRPRDRRQSLLRNTHKVVRVAGTQYGVNCYGQSTIRAVLESDREGNTARELAMQLGFRGPCANGSNGQAVRKVLRRYGIQHFRSDRESHSSKIKEELAGYSQALVDLEGLVNVRIVDQTLPADSRAWLLEVGAHDNDEVIGELLGEGLKERGIFEGGGRIMDRARSDDYDELVGRTIKDSDGIATALENGGLGLRCLEWR